MKEPVLGRDYVVVPTYDELKARIRELEQQLQLAISGSGRELSQRIAKAQAILEKAYQPMANNSMNSGLWEALQALEGK